MKTENIPYKIYLSESEMPQNWYNVRADMKNKPAPLVNPGTGKPMGFDDLRPVFCDELIEQELDNDTPYIPIPQETREDSIAARPVVPPGYRQGHYRLAFCGMFPYDKPKYTSRGTNVDEAALLAGLESGKVRAAGLDVYADEPATNKALYSHPMVSCTPHIGAATVEAQKRIGAEIVDIISKM